MPFCSNCGNENPQGVRFCGNCGTEQNTSQASCPKCGIALKKNEKFCSSCGTSLKTGSPKPPVKPKPEEPKLTKEGRKIIDAGPKPNQNHYPPPPRPPVTSARKKKKRGFAGCLLAFLVIIAIVVVAGIFIVNLATDWFGEVINKTEIASVVNSDNSAADKPQKNHDWSGKEVKTKTRSTLITQNVKALSGSII